LRSTHTSLMWCGERARNKRRVKKKKSNTSMEGGGRTPKVPAMARTTPIVPDKIRP